MNKKKIPAKKAVAVLTFAFVVFGAITAVLVFWQVLPNSPGANMNRVPYSERFELELADGDDIRLSLGGADIKVTPYEGDTLTAAFEGAVPAGSEETGRLVAQRSGNLIEIIQSPDSRFRLNVSMFSFGSDGSSLRGVLSVQVPRKHINRVQAETSSGNITISDIAADGLTAAAGSGNVSLNGCAAGSLEVGTFSGNTRLEGGAVSGAASVSTSSGDVDIAGFGAESLSITTFSGNVRLTDSEVTGDFHAGTSSGNIGAGGLTAGRTDAGTFSGNVELSGLMTENAGISTSSGDIALELGQSADIACETFSGDVELALPAAMGFDLSFDTFSGNLSSRLASMNIPGGMKAADLSVGDGARTVEVSTASGNLIIRE